MTNPTRAVHDAPDLKLYDDTIQALYGIGLKIEYCIALFDSSPDQAKAGLDDSINGLGGLIESLRERIDRLNAGDNAVQRRNYRG